MVYTEQTRAQIISSILSQEHNIFTESELQSMGMSVLLTLQETLTQKDEVCMCDSAASLYVSLPNTGNDNGKDEMPDPWNLKGKYPELFD